SIPRPMGSLQSSRDCSEPPATAATSMWTVLLPTSMTAYTGSGIREVVQGRETSRGGEQGQRIVLHRGGRGAACRGFPGSHPDYMARGRSVAGFRRYRTTIQCGATVARVHEKSRRREHRRGVYL